MKQIILATLVCFGVISCSNNKSAIIDVELNGAPQKEIVVSKLNVNQIKVLDTVKTNNSGKAKITVSQEDASPNFYYLSYGRKKIASLLIKPGDKIKVSVDTLGNNLNIQGPEETLLLIENENQLLRSIAQFDSLSLALSNAVENKDDKQAEEIRFKLGRVYVAQKQSAIKSLMKNPYSFTNINLLYQQFTEALPVFAGEHDGLYTKRVFDSLSTLYPNSVYVKALQNEVSFYENNLKLRERIGEVEESSFPEISLPNVNAEKISLTSLKGKPFILYFWSNQDVNQRLYNKELKDIYNKYRKQGLNIYQVCIDNDKTAWATAIKDQDLEWINVCDGLGTASPVVSLYNITEVPTMFVFDSEGDLVGRNIFDKAKLDNQISKIVK